MKILLSDLAMRGLSKDIARVMGSRPFECVSFEDAVASGRRDFDVAFVSRDVTGLSTKHELAPSLKACYQVLEESPNLRWVHIHSAGADRDVYVRLKAKGVQVATSSGANAEVVAQTALAGLLALSRKFPELIHAMHAKKWAPLLGSQFFITVAATTWLNRKHTIFGQVTDPASQKVIDAIATVKTGANDKPVQAVKIESVTIK